MEAAALRRQYDLVFRFVRRRVSSRVEAEDITQEVFADAAAWLGRYEALSERETLAWLYVVARRRLIDEARRSARAAADGSSALQLVPTPETEYGPSVARDIQRALWDLPSAQSEVVLLKLFDGLTFAQIGARLGISEAAAKMRCVRGLEQVRTLLRREGIEP